MTDQERDPEATGPEGATDAEASADAETAPDGAPEPVAPESETAADATDDAEDAAGAATDADQIPEPEAWTVGAEDPELGAAAAVPATGAAAGKGRGGAKGSAPKQAHAAASVADEAVKVSDRASAIFVIAVVGVFVAILAWGAIGGKNGFLGGLLATPTPVETVAPDLTPEPSVTASDAPSAPASAEPSTVPSVEPSAVPSVEPSAAPSAEPSAAPSEAPPSASPDISPSPAAS